jgi:hypothetical protein
MAGTRSAVKKKAAAAGAAHVTSTSEDSRDDGQSDRSPLKASALSADADDKYKIMDVSAEEIDVYRQEWKNAGRNKWAVRRWVELHWFQLEMMLATYNCDTLERVCIISLLFVFCVTVSYGAFYQIWRLLEFLPAILNSLSTQVPSAELS